MTANNSNKEIKFIDLFAGIGGIRIAFERAGGKCVFTSECDRSCQLMYKANFAEEPLGDITELIRKQVGNSVVIPKIEAVGSAMIKAMIMKPRNESVPADLFDRDKKSRIYAH